MEEYTDKETVERYESIPILQWKDFQDKSFLHWKQSNSLLREKFFRGANSYIEGLEMISHKYPNVQIVRGTSLENLSNLEANFSVGGIETALLYSKRNVHLQSQSYPIILFTPLDRLLPLMRNGEVVSVDPWEVYKEMLTDFGIVNLRFSNSPDRNLFTICKPNHNRAPNNLLATI